MLKRTVSGVVYVGIIVGFFLLRNVEIRLFDIFLYFLSFMGVMEVARAVKPFSMKGSFAVAIISGILFTPVYLTAQHFLGNSGWFIGVDLILVFAIGLAVYALINKCGIKNYAVSILPVIYPNILILFMLLMNNMGETKGFLGLLLMFVISPCADVFAYLVGITYSKIRKGKAKKLCPKLSPNKTVAGGIGGIIGGAVGGIIVYFIFKEKALTLNTNLPLFVFALLGLFGSVLTEIGDLFESFIKRRCGIKDMGKIMPGHGGVMDRIDGMSFCALLICIVFLFM